MATKTEQEVNRQYNGAYGSAFAEILALQGYLERTFGDLPQEQRAAAVQELRAFAQALRAILAGRESVE